MALIMTLMIKSMVMIAGATVKRVKFRVFQRVQDSVAIKIKKREASHVAHMVAGTRMGSFG